MTTPKRKTSNAGAILARITGKDPKLRQDIAEQRLNVRIAEMIYEAREASGLSQVQVAGLVGTTQSVIARLEDADYEGLSVSMLLRIVEALDQKLEVPLVPAAGRR